MSNNRRKGEVTTILKIYSLRFNKFQNNIIKLYNNCYSITFYNCEQFSLDLKFSPGCLRAQIFIPENQKKIKILLYF